MDWSIQPAPFRTYDGVTPILLPLLNRDSAAAHADLYERLHNPAWDFELENIAAFLELSLGLSAWKQVGNSAPWALRMNPSSGNLHPTEAHLVLPPMAPQSRQARAAGGVLDQHELLRGGIFHYNPHAHALEPRALFDSQVPQKIRGHFQTPGFLIGLTSIYWREAWKYGERALRYCHLDIGHALAALSFAGNLLGWKVTYLNALSDGDLSIALGLNAVAWPDDEAEQPQALCFVSPAAVKAIARGIPSEILRAIGNVNPQGMPSALSRAHAHWPLLQAASESLRKPRTPETSVRFTDAAPLGRTPASASTAAALIRARRSAVAFDGVTSISRAQFDALLDKTLPRNGVAPFDLELGEPRVDLLIFAHRVIGLESGLYFLMRGGNELRSWQRSTERGLPYRRVDGSLPLYALKAGSFEKAAATISCHQALAGRGAVAISMLAPFRPLLERTPWLYKHLFWECGQIGQTLYLEAEAQGLRGTGIGCFFDDELHALLGIQQQSFQSLYHFSIGGPVDDDRLTTSAAYSHLPRDRRV